jgi:hypothetical protein
MTKDYLREEAIGFFEWCRFNLGQLAESLTQEDRNLFKSGKLPAALIAAVDTAWGNKLKTSLTWPDSAAAVKKALPSAEDYNAFMNSPYGNWDGLSKRIVDAINKEHTRKQSENHAAYLASSGRERLAYYLRIWLSQSLALSKLISDAWGYTKKPGGGASLGGIEIDVERMMLSQVEATGSAMNVRGLLPFIRSLWEVDKGGV